MLGVISTCLKPCSQYSPLLTIGKGHDKIVNRWRLEPESTIPGHILYREKSSISEDESIPICVAD